MNWPDNRRGPRNKSMVRYGTWYGMVWYTEASRRAETCTCNEHSPRHRQHGVVLCATSVYPCGRPVRRGEPTRVRRFIQSSRGSGYQSLAAPGCVSCLWQSWKTRGFFSCFVGCPNFRLQPIAFLPTLQTHVAAPFSLYSPRHARSPDLSRGDEARASTESTHTALRPPAL